MELDIAKQIKKLQKSKNVTQKEISENIGVTITGFQNMLRNNDFKTSVLIKISDYFFVPIAFFFTNKSLEEFIRSNKEGNETLTELGNSKKEIDDLNNRITEKDELISMYKDKIFLITEALTTLLNDLIKMNKLPSLDLKRTIEAHPHFKFIQKMAERDGISDPK